MRIGIDARYASRHFPGIGRYIVGLTRALAELETGHTLVLITNRRSSSGRYDLDQLAQLPGVELAAVAASPFGLAQHAALPVVARRRRLDVLHAPYYVRPYVGLPCPVVVTIYDLVGFRLPQALSWRGRLLYGASMSLAVRTAATVITSSESAREEIRRRFGLGAERLAVTPLAAGRQFVPRPAAEAAAVRARYGLPERYVLYVGANKPHKNLLGLARAWELLLEDAGGRTQDPGGRGSGPWRWRPGGGAREEGQARLGPGGSVLAIAGHEDRKHRELRRFVAERSLGGSVRLLPDVADADLPALYSGATVFVFPSLYEGFGLPPLEAMACGAPVLCAGSTSLPEVVGDGALLFDPASPAALMSGLRRLLGSAELRRELSLRGQRRAREFSWRRTAMETLRVYERLGA